MTNVQDDLSFSLKRDVKGVMCYNIEHSSGLYILIPVVDVLTYIANNVGIGSVAIVKDDDLYAAAFKLAEQLLEEAINGRIIRYQKSTRSE